MGYYIRYITETNMYSVYLYSKNETIALFNNAQDAQFFCDHKNHQHELNQKMIENQSVNAISG